MSSEQRLVTNVSTDTAEVYSTVKLNGTRTAMFGLGFLAAMLTLCGSLGVTCPSTRKKTIQTRISH